MQADPLTADKPHLPRHLSEEATRTDRHEAVCNWRAGALPLFDRLETALSPRKNAEDTVTPSARNSAPRISRGKRFVLGETIFINGSGRIRSEGDRFRGVVSLALVGLWGCGPEDGLHWRVDAWMKSSRDGHGGFPPTATKMAPTGFPRTPTLFLSALLLCRWGLV